MSGPELHPESTAAHVTDATGESAGSARPSRPRSYGTIVIVGGGCYGFYYVTQLHRASAAGALTYRKLIVVDKNPHCAVAAADYGDVQLACEDWTSFFDRYLGSVPGDTADAIVPSPLMPHLMFQWLLRRAAARWPGRTVETRPL